MLAVNAWPPQACLPFDASSWLVLITETHAEVMIACYSPRISASANVPSRFLTKKLSNSTSGVQKSHLNNCNLPRRSASANVPSRFPHQEKFRNKQNVSFMKRRAKLPQNKAERARSWLAFKEAGFQRDAEKQKESGWLSRRRHKRKKRLAGRRLRGQEFSIKTTKVKEEEEGQQEQEAEGQRDEGQIDGGQEFFIREDEG